VTLADVGAAAVAGVLALVPTAVVLLGLDAVATRLDLGARLGRTGRRIAAIAIGGGVATSTVVLTWAFAGANYLKPRCVAFAAPVYAGADAGDGDAAPVASDGLRVDVAGDLPAWAAALAGPDGFAFVEARGRDGRLARAPDPAAAGTARVLLRVRRSSRRVNAWMKLWTDRFTVIDRVTGAQLARGSEMWVEAGPTTWRCGVASGPLPVRVPAYTDPAALRTFVLAAARPLAR
jgi:hypothetical protein